MIPRRLRDYGLAQDGGILSLSDRRSRAQKLIREIVMKLFGGGMALCYLIYWTLGVRPVNVF